MILLFVIYRLLEMVHEGCPGHGPVHLLSAALQRLASNGILMHWPGLGLICLCSVIWLALFSTSRLLFLMPGETRLPLIFVGGKVFEVGHGSLQLLNSSHVREREKALLRTIMVGGVWNGFLLGRVRGQAVSCRFCGAPDNDGHLFWDCPFPTLVEIRENPEFHDLMRLDKARWPRCLLWHGWLPMLSGVKWCLTMGC